MIPPEICPHLQKIDISTLSDGGKREVCVDCHQEFWSPGPDERQRRLDQIRAQVADLLRMREAHRAGEHAVLEYWRAIDRMDPAARAEFEAWISTLQLRLDRPAWLSPPPPREEIEAARARLFGRKAP